MIHVNASVLISQTISRVLLLGFDVFDLCSGALTQAIRNFAKSLEGWLNNAMNAIPQRMIQIKVHLQDFKRYTK